MLHLYSSLTRQKEPFTPIKEGKVGIYACGITPQNSAHLGHGVSAVRFQMLRRYLTYRGYEVTFVQNVTDVDDKIIARSKETGESPKSIAERYTKEYYDGMGDFGLAMPDHIPKVSEYIPQIIAYTEKLIDNGSAYATEEGDVYFNVSEKEGYGKLSGQKLSEMEEGVRVDLKSDKKHPADFALWKADTTEGASWESPWGQGRPGWHIECSVMANTLLGPNIDIHCGGLDLIFPHHENEVAQCEAHNGCGFANWWVHSGLLNIDGVKMSKSLGNFITMKDGIDKYGAELMLYVILKHHYRSGIDMRGSLFTENMNQLLKWHKMLEAHVTPETMDYDSVTKLEEDFISAMDDDLGTSQALVVLNEGLKVSFQMQGEERRALEAKLIELARVLGLLHKSYSLRRYQEEGLRFLAYVGGYDAPSREEIEQKMSTREEARAEKNYELSDQIRDELLSLGVRVMDSDGSREWEFSS